MKFDTGIGKNEKEKKRKKKHWEVQEEFKLLVFLDFLFPFDLIKGGI